MISSESKEAIGGTVVCQTFGDLTLARDDWMDLRRRHRAETPLSEPTRFAAVLAIEPQSQPHVVIFRHDDKSCGLLVGKIVSESPIYRFAYLRIKGPQLRCLHVAYDGMLIDDDSEAQKEVILYLRRLLRDGIADHININHLRVESPIKKALSGAFGMKLIQVVSDSHWQFELAGGSYQKVLGRLSSKHRYNLRRSDRKLVEHFNGEVKVDVYSSPGDVRRYLERVSELSRGTYQFALGAAVVDTQYWRDVCAVEAENGRLRAYILECGGRPIAYEHGVVYGETFFLEARGYAAEFASLEPGNVLLMRVVENLCSLGITAIDFGFGDGEYKRNFGTESWNEAIYHLYGRGFRALLCRCLSVCSRWVSDKSRRMASLGLVKRLKKRWRARLSQKSQKQPKVDDRP